MITITNKGSNYLARVMKIDNVHEIKGARTLQKTLIDYQEVAISKDVNVGDIVVYFPAGAKIDHEYLSATNSFADKELNADTKVSGYFNSKGLVKAARFMKGQINSTGYVVPAYSYFKEGYSIIPDFINQEHKDFAPIEFDTINGKVVVEKYVAPIRGGNINGIRGKQAKKLSRLVDNQVYLHSDTDNLRRNITSLDVNAPISISYKIHGTSGWAAHVPVKRVLSLSQRLLRKLGVPISETEYDLVYGSRRVVKNKHFDPKGEGHYFGYDLWKSVVDDNNLKHLIPKNYTIYYEICGFTKDGGYIQSGYDYGENKGNCKLYVYRVTNVNADGIVYNLSTSDMMKFCERVGLAHVPVFHSQTSLALWQSNKLQNNDVDYQNIIQELEKEYNGKNCYMCTNDVPEEGVVVRVESDPFEWKAFKLKDFKFLGKESDQLEKDTKTNIEDAN